MKKPVKHEITLLALEIREDGSKVICDIIETSYHHASYFARQFYRDSRVHSMCAVAPSQAWGTSKHNWKEIVR